ncbi:MAG TPA: 50S ribosomal protein L24 [Candidatus Paceibacterota bacterium]
MNLKKGDKVQIIKGKDRGKSGKIVRALPAWTRGRREAGPARSMVVVEGLNLKKKTVRPKKQGETGEIISVPWPVRVENVMLICHSCNRPTRLGYRKTDSGKIRYCRKCQAPN